MPKEGIICSVDDGWRYAEEVVAGNIVASKYVIKQCKRVLDDYNNGNKHWKFNEDEAQKVINLFPCLRHIKGEKANKGETLVLEPFQIFNISQIYGWYSVIDPALRRFLIVINFMGRKNGKTIIVAGLSLREVGWGDRGAEVYSVATKSDQAKICWDMAYDQMRLLCDEGGSKKLRNYFHKAHSTISCMARQSKFTYLGRDSKGYDGLNPSLLVVDEAAAVTDRNMIEVMTSGMGARKCPLTYYITTASFTKDTEFYEKYLYAKSVLDGEIQDDRIFAMLYELDEGDDFEDENVWIKANPNLDVSINRDFLRKEVAYAKANPAAKNNILVKNFNIFTSTSSAWISMDKWEDCEKDKLDRTGGMWLSWDLAQTRDLSSVCRVWANGDHYECDFKCFIPKPAMELVPVHYKPIYLQAWEQGTLHVTQGQVTDYEEILNYIRNSITKYDLRALGGDPYNANSLIHELSEDGFECHRIHQGIAQMSPSSKETERLIYENMLKHEKNVFVDWQFRNAEVYTDVNENIKIRKGDDPNRKIDSVIALISAISMAAGNLDNTNDFFLEVFN